MDTKQIDPRFIAHMPVDIKLTIAWDADDCCIDLHSMSVLLTSFLFLPQLTSLTVKQVTMDIIKLVLVVGVLLITQVALLTPLLGSE